MNAYERMEELNRELRNCNTEVIETFTHGDSHRVFSSMSNFGSVDCTITQRWDGNSGFPTWVTFGVEGGQVQFFNGKGEEIDTNSVTIYLVGDAEHSTFKSFIMKMHEILSKDD